MHKPRTEDLPAMEGPGVAQRKIPAVEKAASDYARIHFRRDELKDQEDIAKEVLIDAMASAGISLYRYDDFEIILTSKINVKVKGIGKEEEPEE